MPTTAAAAPQTMIDLVRVHYPDYPATQPLDQPTELRDAARIIVHAHVYICARGDLWITRDDAPPIQRVLADAANRQVHLLRRQPLYVQWTVNDRGVAVPIVVCRSPSADALDVIDLAGQRTLHAAYAYDWSRAFPWGTHVVVPSPRGVSLLQLEPTVSEDYVELTDTAAGGAAPQVLPDWRGLLAWVPSTSTEGPATAVARYVDGHWMKLGPNANWPGHILQLVPLLDGSVLQILPVQHRPQSVHLQLAVLDADAAGVDPRHIEQLVAQLSADQATQRNAAFSELSRYGPPVWPVLDKLQANQPPEARLRLQQLLRAAQSPTLGGMSLVDSTLRVIIRQEDGTVVFYADGGVSVPDEDDATTLINPAWIVLRPGWPVRLLPHSLVADARPDTFACRFVNGETVVTDTARGPQRFFGNELVPLLRPSERQFSRLEGVDRTGRWIFTQPQNQSARPTSTAGAPTTDHTAPAALILDPWLPDPTPRLPAWQIDVENGSVGWDASDWPVVRREGAWALNERNWVAIKPDETVFTDADQAPPPTTSPLAAPSTQSAGLPGAPILVCADGTKYFDGRDQLVQVAPSGTITRWPLPPLATGSLEKPRLIRTADGLLFLYNQPGRLLRIRPTPAAPEPFELQATFTHAIPSTDRVARMWLDRAGRIVFAYDDHYLTILFPSGHIPRPIATLMPVDQLEDLSDP